MVVWEMTWQRFWNGFLFLAHVDEVGYPKHIKKTASTTKEVWKSLLFH